MFIKSSNVDVKLGSTIALLICSSLFLNSIIHYGEELQPSDLFTFRQSVSAGIRTIINPKRGKRGHEYISVYFDRLPYFEFKVDNYNYLSVEDIKSIKNCVFSDTLHIQILKSDLNNFLSEEKASIFFSTKPFSIYGLSDERKTFVSLSTVNNNLAQANKSTILITSALSLFFGAVLIYQFKKKNLNDKYQPDLK